MAFKSNVETRKIDPGSGKIKSPLRDTIKSGNTSTKRDR